MSVIAWDGKSIAADRQETYGGLMREGRKLFQKKIRKRSCAIGLTGHINSSYKLLDWFCKGGGTGEFSRL